MLLKKIDKIVKIKTEITEIIKAIDDEKNDLDISDFYEDYCKSMLGFIKSKNSIWFDKLFDIISDEIYNKTTEALLKKKITMYKFT